jgi:hypothetical protein
MWDAVKPLWDGAFLAPEAFDRYTKTHRHSERSLRSEE